MPVRHSVQGQTPCSSKRYFAPLSALSFLPLPFHLLPQPVYSYLGLEILLCDADQSLARPSPPLKCESAGEGMPLNTVLKQCEVGL